MGQQPAKLLWVMFFSCFTFGMITNVLGVVIPLVSAEYNLTRFEGGIMAFAFFLAYGVCSIPTAMLVDRFGARRLILFGAALMAVGCFGVSQARNYPVILTTIFAVGVGVTILQTSGNPLIQHLDRLENYHRNLTLTIGVCGIGAASGPFVLALFQGTGRPWPELYLFFAAMCALVLALMAPARFPAQATAATDRVRLDRVARLLATPLVLFYTLGIFFYVGGEVGTASWIVKFFDDAHHMGGQASLAEGTSVFRRVLPTLPALVVALFWGLQGGGRMISGAMLNRLGSRRILRLYSFLTLACLLLATFGSSTLTAAGFAACGFFTSVLFTLIFSGTINSVTEHQGTVSGLLCSAAIGGAIMPPVVGLVGDHLGMRTAMTAPAFCFAYVFGLSMFGRAKYK